VSGFSGPDKIWKVALDAKNPAEVWPPGDADIIEILENTQFA
jgi:hypothetical protein